MRLYHFALGSVADSIMRNGFRDSEPEVVAGIAHEGVWLSDLPLAEDGELPPDEFVSVVDVSDAPRSVRGRRQSDGEAGKSPRVVHPGLARQ